MEAADDEVDKAELDERLRHLAEVLAAEGAHDAHPRVADESAGRARPRIAAAVAAMFARLAARVPVVVVCDDVQWADDASLHLLDDVVARLSESPVLVVCAARPDLYERRPLWGEGASWHQRLDVGPLPRRYVEEMVRDRLRAVPDLDEDIVRTLAERADQNPLTLVESLHLLVDAGVIELAAAGPWTVHADRLGALALPATVQGIVQARLDRLEPEARGVLARAAVIGKTFWESAVERLLARWRADAAEEGTSPPPDGPLGSTLGALRARQLIRLRESATFAGEREYVFAESATQEVAYEMLSLKVRRPAHLLVARWLEERGAGVAASHLALHFERGGDARRAATESGRAAAHAAALGQNQEALRHYQHALRIHDAADADFDPAARGADESARVADWRERVTLRLELGDVLRRVGRHDEAEDAYEQARQRILRNERRLDAPFDILDASRWEARLDFRLALLHKVRGEIDRASALAETAIQRARAAGAADETPPMYALLAVLHRRRRDSEASWRAALEGLRVCRTARRSDERWREEVAELLFGLAAVLYMKGRMGGAERSYRQASRILGKADNPHLSGVALNGVAAARIARGDLAGARELFSRSLRLKERAGDLHQIAVACSNLAEVELRSGNPGAAVEQARRSVRLGEQARAGSDLAAMYHNLAEATLAAGDVGAALGAADQALAIAEVAGHLYLGDVARTLARACAAAARLPDLAARATEARKRLETSLARHFDGDATLGARADECRRILAAQK